MSVKESLLTRTRSLPRRLLEFCLRMQRQAGGLVSIRGHHVFTPGLGRSSVVIDAGAHLGEFSLEIADRFGCLCYAIEPVPELFSLIPEHPQIKRFRFALGGTDGEAVLHLSDNPEAHSVHADIASAFGSRGTRVAADLTSLESFLEQTGLENTDLLKLDIEGCEVAVLEDTRQETLQRIGQISVEFHDFLDSFRERCPFTAIKRRLRRAGFTCIVFSRPAGNHADTLFINHRRHRLGPGRRLNLFLMRHVTLELQRLLHLTRSLFSSES
jgi:FkbM family methyltransferase